MKLIFCLMIILFSLSAGDYVEEKLIMPQDRLLINGKWNCSNVEGLECKYILIESEK